MAAAVSDYRPESGSDQKLKKNGRARSISLVETDDILKSLLGKKGKRLVVGFAAETERLTENAEKKLKNKGLDLVIANDVTQEGAGFDVDTNIVEAIDAKGKRTPFPKMSKRLLARYILEEIVKLKPTIS